MKFWKKCPLLLLLSISAIAAEVVGAANRETVYAGYRSETAVTPLLAAVFQGAREGILPWEDEVESALAQGGKTMPAKSAGEQAGETASRPEEESEISGSDEIPAMDSADGTEDETAAETQSEADEEPETYEFCRVEEDYFDDALFIGDSRTQGLLEYGGIEDRATFYCQTSLTVYDLFAKEKAFIREEGEKLTLTQALERHQFGKIYLMIGINEMGTGTPESFFEEYARAVYRIRELQPDAILFVQGIMRVAGEKNASDPIFNNTNINIRNVEIATLEDRKDIFYIDVNEVVCDESGNLYGDWTFDQIHLKAKYYQVWKEFLLDHGIVR